MRTSLEKAFLALLGLLAFAGISNAQCYNRTYSYAPTYVERELVPIAVPVPYTVAVPVVSYLYNGATFAPVFNAQPAIATGVLQQTQQQMPQAQQPQAQRPQAKAPQEISDELIDRLIERIEKRLEERKNGSRSRSQSNAPPPLKERAMSNASSQAIAVLADNCASCHTGSKSGGRVQIFLGDGSFNTGVNKNKLLDAVEDGRMPKEPHDLLDEYQTGVLRQWVQSGRVGS